MIEKMPVISIIIPVYNAEKYLVECVDSVLKQSFSDFELILVNDGSADGSLEICRNYAAADGRVKVIDGKNEGVSAARNKGLSIARGEWIAFVDADDYLLPNAFCTLYERAKTTEADIVLGNAVKLIDGRTTKPLLKLTCETLPNAISGIKHFALWGYLMRRSIIQENNIRFIEGLAYSEDRIFIYQMAKYCQTIAYTDEPVYVYRINESSACSSKDGLRKACHHFKAGYHLHCLAMTFEKNELKKLLISEGWHTVNLGIYQCLAMQGNWKTFAQMRNEFYKHFKHNVRNTMRLWYYAIADYTTIQRRKIIRFKKR